MISAKDLVEEVALRLGDPAGEEVTYKFLYRLATRAEKWVAEETLCNRRVQTLTLSDSANAYRLDDGFLKEFSVISKDSSDGASRLKHRSRLQAKGSRDPRFPSKQFYFVEQRLVNGTHCNEDAPAMYAPCLVLWPWDNEAIYDVNEHGASGSTLEVYMAKSPSRTATGTDLTSSDSLELPHYASEAVMLETVACAAMLPQSRVSDMAMQYRQLADRSIAEVKRRCTDASGQFNTPIPTTY